MIAATGFGLACLEPARAAGPSPFARGTQAGREVAELLALSEASNTALLRGDVDRYRAMLPIAHDFTLMTPFGGKPSHAHDVTDAQWDAMKRFFKDGTLAVELVQAYHSSDLVVLALIEHTHVAVGDVPAQDWKLRVTLVYRRDRAGWHLAHRHADPLGRRISVAQAAALARGERA
jgi:ketosteroid isomerase-like protein